jgi:hypothetical protein
MAIDVQFWSQSTKLFKPEQTITGLSADENSNLYVVGKTSVSGIGGSSWISKYNSPDPSDFSTSPLRKTPATWHKANGQGAAQNGVNFFPTELLFDPNNKLEMALLGQATTDNDVYNVFSSPGDYVWGTGLKSINHAPILIDSKNILFLSYVGPGHWANEIYLNSNPLPVYSVGSLTAVNSPLSEWVSEPTMVDWDGDTLGIAITSVDNTNGEWQFSKDNGASWLGSNTDFDNGQSNYSDNFSRLIGPNVTMRFIPKQGYIGSSSFNFRLWDLTNLTNRNDKSALITGSVSKNGGDTAFSAVTSTIKIGITNYAPVFDTAYLPQLPSISYKSTNSPGNTVESLVPYSAVEDGTYNFLNDATGEVEYLTPDKAVRAIAITSVDNSNGAWQFSTNGGTTWQNFGNPTENQARLLNPDHKIRFLPNAGYLGNASFTFRAWDRTNGTAGQTFDATANGGTTPFSAETRTATITTTNTAPVLNISGNPTLNSISHNIADQSNLGKTVAELVIDGSITDTDGAVEQIAVTSVDDSNGTWQYSLDNGQTWVNFGLVDTKQARLLESNHRIRFVPNQNFVGEATFTYKAWDGSNGVGDLVADVTNSGEQTPFSINTETGKINVTNSAPTIVVDNTAIITTINIDNGGLITDFNTTEFSFTVSGIGEKIEDLDVRFSAKHSWNQDLDVTLVSPQGKILELFSDIGGQAKNFQDTLLNDEAAINIANANAPFNGIFQPEGINKLSIFDGDNPNGKWILRVVDDEKLITGTLYKSGDNADWGTAIGTQLIFTTLNNTLPLPAITNSNSNPQGNTIEEIIPGNKVTDNDGNSQKSIAIISIDNSKGKWQYSLNSGETWTDINAVSNSSALLLDQSHKIRFVPNAGFVGKASFDFRAWDKTTGTSGQYANTTINGGNTAFSTVIQKAEITVTKLDSVGDTFNTAFDTGLTSENKGAFTLNSVIGDNASKSPQTDIDFYKVQLKQGELLTINVATQGSLLDSMVWVYDSKGLPLAFSDNSSEESNEPLIYFTTPYDDSFYLGVSASGNYVPSPFIEESSRNVATTTSGAYAVTVKVTDELPIINLGVSPNSVTEDGTGNLIYTFTRIGKISSALTVNYTVGGTATLGTDYTGISSSGTTKTVTFAAGSATAIVTVDPTADTTVEADDTVALTLVDGTGYTIGTTGAVTGTITNDDGTTLPSITLSVSPASVLENGTSNLVYTFTRTGATTNTLTVNYSVAGTADNTDYTGTTTGTGKTVTFAAGSATAIVTIDPTADTTVESDETVALTLATGTGYTIGTTAAVTGTITNDDGTTLPSITLAVSPASVLENGTSNLVYTFTRSGATTSTLTTNYIVGGTATLGTDYTGISSLSTTKTVSFAAGSSTAIVTVDPTGDTTVESNETVALTLATGTGYTIGTTAAVTGTITNDDGTTLPSITLAVSPASVLENGTSNLVYTFTRSGATTSTLTTNYTVGGSATLGTDYTGISSLGTTKTVTFAAGSSTAIVTVDPTGDTTVESNETVALTLATGTGYTIGTTAAVTGTITNDDVALPSITLAVSPVSVLENGTSNLVYTFTRSGATTSTLTTNYTVGGTATLGTDYTGISSLSTTKTVTFAAGSSTAIVTVDPTGDTTVESNETVALTLATGTGYTIGTTGAVTGTITNDDVDDVALLSTTLAISPSSVTENGTGTILNDDGLAGGLTLTGTSSNDILTGASTDDILTGLAGADNLDGQGGADKFVYNTFTDSLLGGLDVIRNFNPGEGDRLDLTTLPSSVFYVGALASSISASAVQAAYTAADGGTGLTANEGVFFVIGSGDTARLYLSVNNGTASFDQSNDLVVDVTRMTGAPTTIGGLAVGNYFV